MAAYASASSPGLPTQVSRHFATPSSPTRSSPPPAAAAGTVPSAARSQLAASRLKLQELQRKSRTLSASLRRHEQSMHHLASSTASVEAAAAVTSARRQASPAWSRYAPRAGGGPAPSSPTGLPAGVTPGVAAAYRDGFERQSSAIRRETAVALARDMAEKRAQVDELQHSGAMKDVQLRVCENELVRLRAADVRQREHAAALTRTVAQYKQHVETQQAAEAAAARSHQALEAEAESLRLELGETRRQLAAERVERESVARQLVHAHDEGARLQRALDQASQDALQQQEAARRERAEFLGAQQAAREHLEQLNDQLHAAVRNASDYRSSALAYRTRSEEAEAALVNVQQVHKATIEQLVTVREQLKREQDARWAAETEAARLRGLVG